MDNENIKLSIGNFLGFVDLNGIEAIDTEKVQALEEYVKACQESVNKGEELVSDAIYDRLMDILSKVNPESELAKYIWEDSTDEVTDKDAIFVKNPMYSIRTCKSFECQEIKDFVNQLPDGYVFTAHISTKLNGHGIRLVYQNGDFINARSRARNSAGRDITKQLHAILEEAGLLHLDDIEEIPLCEVRGELLLPFKNLDKARTFNKDIVSAFTGVSSMSRDSATEEEWKLLRFVAYKFLADDMTFDSKEAEYTFLEGIGFEVPLYWVVEDIAKDGFIETLKSIVSDCEIAVKPSDTSEGYDYYTDGLVFEINKTSEFKRFGDDGSKYNLGNLALKVGYWKQDLYYGYVQTILWLSGKTKLTPVAIVAEDIDMAKFKDLGQHPYIFSTNSVSNYQNLGVVTAGGNKVRKVPLYEANNIIQLNAYVGELIHFRYGGEAGVVPCFEDGTLLTDSAIHSKLKKDIPSASEEWVDDYEDDYISDEELEDDYEDDSYEEDDYDEDDE